jgi:TolA-binding protein
MPRYDGAEESQRGELLLLLGRAYYDTAELEEAEAQLERAASMLGEFDPRRTRAELLLAGIAETLHDDVARARDIYEHIVHKREDSVATFEAMLRLAEANAGLGRDEEAIENYATLAEMLRRGTALVDMGGHARDPGDGAHEGAPGAPEGHAAADRGEAGHAAEEHGAPARAAYKNNPVTPGAAAQSLLTRFSDRYVGGQTGLAMRYATQAEDLFAENEAPGDVYLALALGNRRLAEEVVAEGGGEGGVDLLEADAATREQARRYYIAAGNYYRWHAGAVAAEDAKAYADSTWLSADSFDLAGDHDRAISGFRDFADAFPTDVRRAQAKFRLAQAYQSRGQYDSAAELYRELVNARGEAGGRRSCWTRTRRTTTRLSRCSRRWWAARWAGSRRRSSERGWSS